MNSRILTATMSQVLKSFKAHRLEGRKYPTMTDREKDEHFAREELIKETLRDVYNADKGFELMTKRSIRIFLRVNTSLRAVPDRYLCSQVDLEDL